MSWSLQLQNGDLTINGAKLGQAEGIQKLTQDLRCALLESRGNDDMHPTLGSIIDGGINAAGVQVASVIGSNNWEFAALEVENEIRRIASEYQRKQTERAKNDRLTYGESTLSNDELLLQISSIKMTQSIDRLLVNVTLQNGQNRSFNINIPINGSNL